MASGTKLTAGETYYTSASGAGQFTAVGNEVAGENQYYKKNNSIIQVVNCYYPESNKYTVPTSDSHGVPTQMADKAFYNGTVAYDLNGFYLYKRYCDQQVNSGTEYKYFTLDADNKPTGPLTKWYATTDASLCSSGVSGVYPAGGYVEDRFRDGDFIYAGGEIPGTPNERLYTDPDTKEKSYHAIWPDDYIFFGQALNYDHMDGNNGRDKRDHQPLPSVIYKSDDRVLTSVAGNRVYRAPAYFRNYNMGVAHFNPYAVFAATKKDDAAVKVYENMTAIDFTGYNDANYDYQKGWSQWSKTSQLSQNAGLSTEAYAFYPPLLDDGGVHDLYIADDLTRNLLAYTMTDTDAAATTDATVGTYLKDEAYAETETAPVTDLYSDTYRYHTVADRDADQIKIHGHRVQKQSASSFLALNDHVLIDKQDFNAPIAYSFDEGQRMWYQRIPDNYVDIAWVDDDDDEDTPVVRTTKGWEGVSLPFKAEIVTTNDKGEITHFYDNSSKNDIGHEYWLRGFVNGGSISGNVYKAEFKYPVANSEDGNKDYTNTFLWDYYYSYNNKKYEDGNTTGEDQNTDEYQENDASRDYYKTEHTYRNYPRLAGATPYIIGFPSNRYYEFDLSGNFEAVTAMNTIPKKLGQQTITFASKPGATTIEVSDNAIGVTEDGYTFKPSYLNNPDVETGKHAFLLNSVGNSYVETDASTASVYAFRPFFIANSSSNPSRQTRSIIFSQNDDDQKKKSIMKPGYITARPGNHKITVSSSLEETVTIRIISPSGLCMATFELQPGESRETHIVNSGVYIVQSSDGRYTRKLSVR